MQDDVIPGHRQYLPRVSRQEEEEDESHCSKRGQATAGSLSFIPQCKTITKGPWQWSDQELYFTDLVICT